MNTTIPAITDWQYLLGILTTSALLLGALLVLTGLGFLRGRRPRAPGPNRVRLAMGVVLLLAGGTGKLLGKRPTRPAEVITEARFSSSRPPALSIDAPPGGELAFDKSTGKLAVMAAGSGLLIETVRPQGDADPAAFMKMFATTVTSQGGTVDETFTDTFDGRVAQGATMTVKGVTSVIWFVWRPGRLLTNITCHVPDGHKDRSLCLAALQSLRWVAPGPL